MLPRKIMTPVILLILAALLAGCTATGGTTASEADRQPPRDEVNLNAAIYTGAYAK